jgi:serine/threonine-protein kinase TNNI3K
VKLAASSEKLPSSLFVHGVKLDSRDPFFGGGFADVYRGVCEGETVAVKKPRALSTVCNPYAASRKYEHGPSLADWIWQRLCREALIWYQLRHPFVLPFIGVDQDNFQTTNLVGLVTPWIFPGTLKDVMKSDRFEAEIDPYVWVRLSQ